MPPPPVADLPPSRGNPLDYHLVVAVSAVVMIMRRVCVVRRPPGFGGAVLQLTRGRPREVAFCSFTAPYLLRPLDRRFGTLDPSAILRNLFFCPFPSVVHPPSWRRALIAEASVATRELT